MSWRIYGAARSLVDWHARHRFCAALRPADRAHQGRLAAQLRRLATAEHFPRVDPVTIMLVEHDDMLLLGRQPRFPPRRFSALAGFVEPGESIEEAVRARGLRGSRRCRRARVGYVASQPVAVPQPADDRLHVDRRGHRAQRRQDELEEARWFRRAEVAEPIAPGGTTGGLPRSAAARGGAPLLNWWLER
jgi:NAD+ diphosphatase